MSLSVQVAFHARGVTVRSGLPGVVDYVRSSFQRLCVSAHAQVDAVLTVDRVAAVHRIRSGSEVLWRGVSRSGMLRQLRHLIIRTLVENRADLCWTHAGAAAQFGRAVLLAGASGRGKSTIVTELCRRGWRYLSDDIVPLDPHTLEAHAFPLTPCIRIPVDHHLAPEHLADLRKRDVVSPLASVEREPVSVGAIIFPVFEPGKAGARLDPTSPAEAVLELVRRNLNFDEAEFDAIALLARLANDVPTYRLSFSDGTEGAGAVERTLLPGFARKPQCGSARAA